MTKRFGSDRAALLAQALSELDALHRLGDIEQLPYLRVEWGSRRREVLVENAQQLRMQLVASGGRRGGGADAWREWTAAVVRDVSFRDQ